MTKLSALAVPLLTFAAACGSTMDDAPGDDIAASPDAQAMPSPDAHVTPPPPDAQPPPPCTVGIDDVMIAHIAIDTDDYRTLWVNGVLIDGGDHTWYEPQVYDVSILRHPSRRNVIAVEGRNTQSIDGLDRGVIVDLRYDLGGEHRVESDGTWKVSASSAPGWETLTFSDASWSAPFVIGPAGIGPWYAIMDNVVSGSTASWIWAYDPSGLATDKPDLDYTYARKTFSVVDPACE